MGSPRGYPGSLVIFIMFVSSEIIDNFIYANILYFATLNSNIIATIDEQWTRVRISTFRIDKKNRYKLDMSLPYGLMKVCAQAVSF